MSFIEDTDFGYDRYAEMIDMQPLSDLADMIVSRLKYAGITILRYDAYSTNSIYLKLDYGVCNSIRISDHKGKVYLKYRYNLIRGMEKSYGVVDKYPRYFYAEEDVLFMIDKIVFDRNTKVQKYGYTWYARFMEENKSKHSKDTKGFWSKARLV